MKQPSIGTLHVRGVDYGILQVGQGPACLLLHGFSGAASSWSPIIPLLGSDHRWIAVDLPGHGRTGPVPEGRYGFESVSLDLSILLHEIEAGPATVVGYSMGGRLALHLALAHPRSVSRLILESASPGLTSFEEREARQASDSALADWIEANGAEAFARRWAELPLFASQRRLPASVQDELHAGRASNDVRGLVGSLRGMGTGVQPPLWESLSSDHVPTLLVVGELDEKFVAINQQMNSSWLIRGSSSLVMQATPFM